MKRSRRNKYTHICTHTHARSFARSKNIERNFDWRCRVLIIIYNIHIYIIQTVESARVRERERERELKCTYSFHISHFALFRPCMTTHFYIVAVSFYLSLPLASILWVFCVTPKLSKNVHHTHSAHLLILLLQNEYKFTLWIELLFICMFLQSARVKTGGNERASERVTIILYMAIYYWYYDAIAEEMSNELTD